MKINKSHTKRKLILEHRKGEYLKAINKVIDGKAKPEYATLRYKKLREVKGK